MRSKWECNTQHNPRSGRVRLGQVLFSSSPLCIVHDVRCPDSAFVGAAGVNQQPPVHQFSMRLFKPFWGWTQTQRSSELFFSSSPAQGFFSLLFCPKVFPSCLPMSSPPNSTFIFSGPGLASFFGPPSLEFWGKLRKVATQGNLELQHGDRPSSLKVSSLPSFPFLFFQIFFLAKRATTLLPLSFSFYLLCGKEDDSNYHRLFF